MTPTKDHNAINELKRQLKELYDCYRTSLLNRKYYGHRLENIRMCNRTIDIILALTAASAIGTWAIWQTAIGTIVWEILFSTAAIIAVIKPFLRISDVIERYGKLFIGYSSNVYTIKKIVSEVTRSKEFTDDLNFAYRNILDSFRNLAPDDDPKPKARLIQKYFNEVNNEVPPESLWMPS